MIEINIIRTRLEKFRNKRVVFQFFIIYFAGLLFLLFIFLMNFLLNKASIVRIKNEIKAIENKIAIEEEKFRYVKVQEEKTHQLLKNMGLFTEEIRSRTLWFPILTFIGENVPAGIWLEKFTVKDTSGKTKGELTVIISGHVLPGKVNERDAIDRFVRNISAGDIFADVFLKEIRKVMDNKTEMLAFQIECSLQKKKEE